MRTKSLALKVAVNDVHLLIDELDSNKTATRAVLFRQVEL